MGRGASGVIGMNLDDEDGKNQVVGMLTIDANEIATRQVLVVSSKGYGKRSPVEDYRIINRGGKGVKTLQVTDKTGKLVAIKDVRDDDHLMIITRNGITIRIGLDEMRVLGRATQGVRLIELRDKDKIAAVAKVDSELHEDENTSEAEASGTPEEGGENNGNDAPDGTDVADGGDEQ